LDRLVATTVVFRVDASIQIGTGHVMRCLTLAHAIRESGNHVYFISREHPGNINDLILQNGFQLFALPVFPNIHREIVQKQLAHSVWLGANQMEDARQCEPILKVIQPDWLIIDHYAIDSVWHKMLQPHVKRIMVIDDIADRRHECDLLLDQNYGKQPSDYLSLVPTKTTLLLGTKYALLRPEFLQWREFSLQRRSNPELKQILITMGGIDANNVTGQILSELINCKLSKKTVIKVVMGSSAPWLKQINQQALHMPYQTEVCVGVTNMAEMMAYSDLAIGAAGSTSWERCCLGLPTITVVLAENQNIIAAALQKVGAAKQLDRRNISAINSLLQEITIDELSKMSISAENIVDGLGVQQTFSHLIVN
jgi:UDP-2,4-diacetamido-2,4,6-trideoxy-beta-L-altropyranose hydrolase